MGAVTILLTPARAATTVAQDRIWFAPGPGTIDYLDLFERPDEWPHARQLVNVFKFYQQHTQTPAPAIVGPNTYGALMNANAFSLLNKWGIKTAIEVGAVKPFYCTADSSGMNAAIANSLDSIRAVQAAGGTVSYLAMDEPFVSGRDPGCGGPALDPTVSRVATYVSGVRDAFPAVEIGLIEAYPFSSESTIEEIVQRLKATGVTLAFLHMDVDWHLSGAAAFTRDMTKLKDFSASQQIPFGIIIVGYNGDADALYAIDAYGVTNLIADAFGTWARMPDHLIFQSWVVTTTGLYITPSNLDERRSFTHTELLWDIYRRLRGATGAATSLAIGGR